MTVRKFTEAELQQIDKEIEELNLKVKRKEVTATSALEEAKLKQEMMRSTDPEINADVFRKKVWNKLGSAIRLFTEGKNEELRESPAFGPDQELDIEATIKVNDVKRMIKKMTHNGQVKLNADEAKYAGEKNNGEKYKEGDQVSVEVQARAHISMLIDYQKYIHSKHPEIKALWQMYNDKTIANYMEYAKNLTKRSSTRDLLLHSKIKQNLDNYSDKNLALAVLSLLEARTPEAEKAPRRRKS